LASACGSKAMGPGNQPADPAFADAAPDADALTIQDENSTVTRDVDDGALGMAAANATAVAEASIIVTPTKAEVEEINGVIKSVIATVQSAIKGVNPTTKTASEHQWVIDTKKGFTLRFTMKKSGEGRFGWLGEVAKTPASGAPANADYKKVLGGVLVREKTLAAGRGAGVIGVDIDTYASVVNEVAASDAQIKARGKIFAGFKHGPKGSLHRYLLKNYTSDIAKPAISLYFEAARVAGPPARIFLRGGGVGHLTGLLADLGVTDTGALEKFHIRLHRIAGFGGFARGVAFGGDLPGNSAFFVRECWNKADQVAYRRIWQCDVSQGTPASLQTSCTIVSNVAAANVGGNVTIDTTIPTDLSNVTPIAQLCFPDVPQTLHAAAIDAIKADWQADVTVGGEDSLTAGAQASTSDSGEADAPTDADAPPADMPSGDGN